MGNETLIGLIEKAIVQNFDSPAFSNYQQRPLLNRDVFIQIKAIHAFYENLEIGKGDKIALYGRNDAEWAVIYLSTISYGAVIVPILADFHPSDVANIIAHSDAKLAFVSDMLFDKLDLSDNDNLLDVLSMQSFASHIKQGVKVEIKDEYSAQTNISDVVFQTFDDSDIAVISYTSGTSGNPKGVMLSHKSLWSNARVGWDVKLNLKPGDTVVSFLPLAHAYGCLFEFLAPYLMGCHIVFLTKVPSPQIIIKAFADCKPKLILAVPLVIEKIYNTKIQPALRSKKIQILLKIPIVKRFVYAGMRKKLNEVFGNNFIEIIVGGASFNSEVERFFVKIGFRITVGYGMTECGPLISYSGWKEHRLGYAGKVVSRMQCRIDSKDPKRIPGMIEVKGDNVMSGYYKNELETLNSFTSDGWLITGDLGILSANNCIAIKGRRKSMILGSNGQNIYPEEVENVINSCEFVLESIVRDNKGRIEALVFPDFESAQQQGLSKDELQAKILSLKLEWNKNLPVYSKIALITFVSQEFEKTPKKSIKRFLYNVQ